MEKYIVNGVEIAYDTFDMDCLEAWEEEVQRVADESGAELENEGSLEKIRRVCEAMKDFFDQVCGEGTARKVFGERTNVRAVYDGYRAFTEEVGKEVRAYAARMDAAAPANRAQRRGAGRGK